jgi:8-oxo-dGTP pyrophosphatase MutT (NUDIX family)
VTDRRPHLLRLLTEYEPSDPDEQAYRLRALDLAAAAHDPFDRHSYRPGHFTASGFVLHPAGDRVLFVHHALLGIWVQPGGHVDPGDATPVDAARREISEETGIADLTPISEQVFDLDVHTFPEGSGQPEHLHFDLRFAFVAGDDSLAPTAEVLEARWVSAAELDGLGVDRSVRRPVGKLLGPDLS